MIKFLPGILLLAFVLASGPRSLDAAENSATWSPQQFGAAADGVTLDTAALQHAIDAAHTKGGGTVRLSPGVYLTGTLELRSNVTLHLARGATLLGSARIADYRRGKWPALLLAGNQTQITLSGEGTIDGQGTLVAADSVRIFESGKLTDFFPGVTPGEKVNLGGDTTTGRVIDPYAMQRDGTLAAVVAPRSRADPATWRVDECVRPQLIEFSHCRGVRVSGVTLKNAANWVQSYRDCEDLEVIGIHVDSTTYWNNDGLDLVNCRRVRIAGCQINAADDGICLKSESNEARLGCEDIAIAHCRIRSSASAVKIGTASFHDFRRIRIEDLDIRDTYRSAVALETVDGGVIEDVRINHVRAQNTGNAFFLRLGQRNRTRPPGALRNVVLSDFIVAVPAGKPDAGYPHEGPPLKVPINVAPAVVAGLPDRPIEGVSLRDIVLTYGGGAERKRAEVPFTELDRVPEQRDGYPEFTMFGELPAWGLYLRHVTNVHLENARFRLAAADFRPAFIADRVAGLELHGVRFGAGGGEPVAVLAGVTGETLRKIEWPADAHVTVRRWPAPGRGR